MWRFTYQGWGREGLKNLFFHQPFLFGPPSQTLCWRGTPTEQPCGDNSQKWDSHNKTDSSNCLQHMLSKTYGASEREENRQLSIRAPSTVLNLSFSCCVFDFWRFDCVCFNGDVLSHLIFIYVYTTAYTHIHFVLSTTTRQLRCNSTFVTCDPTFFHLSLF